MAVHQKGKRLTALTHAQACTKRLDTVVAVHASGHASLSSHARMIIFHRESAECSLSNKPKHHTLADARTRNALFRRYCLIVDANNTWYVSAGGKKGANGRDIPHVIATGPVPPSASVAELGWITLQLNLVCSQP